MGPDDEIVIANRNHPATQSVAGFVIKEVIQYPGHDAPTVVDLITMLMSLDRFHTYSALRMEIDNEPETMLGVNRTVWDVLTLRLPEGGILASLDRWVFCRHAGQCTAVVHCSEE